MKVVKWNDVQGILYSELLQLTNLTIEDTVLNVKIRNLYKKLREKCFESTEGLKYKYCPYCGEKLMTEFTDQDGRII